MPIYLAAILVVVAAYFLGCFNGAMMISRRIFHDDVRTHGSGNAGLTNFYRTYGAQYALLVIVCDMGKTAIATAIGGCLFRALYQDWTLGVLIAGLSCIIGHVFPATYKFKGGKGVACALGVFMVSNPLYLLIAFVIGFVYVWFFDYGSVASLFIVAFMAVVQGWQFSQSYLDGKLPLESLLTINILLFVIFSLIWFAHRSNIIRLSPSSYNSVMIIIILNHTTVKAYIFKQITYCFTLVFSNFKKHFTVGF